MERNGASASRSRTIMNDHVNTSDHVFTNQESDLQIIPRPEVPDLKITVKSFKYQKSEFRKNLLRLKIHSDFTAKSALENFENILDF